MNESIKSETSFSEATPSITVDAVKQLLLTALTSSDAIETADPNLVSLVSEGVDGGTMQILLERLRRK